MFIADAKIATLALFMLAVLAVCVSIFVAIKNRGDDRVLFCLWKYFSYYTVLSNILVLVWAGLQIFLPDSHLGQFAANANVAAAVTFYITTVGVANYLLYGWQHLAWLEQLSDLLVHALVPLFTLVHWILVSEKTELNFDYAIYWLTYPLSYALYTISHGKWTRFYPYEFTNMQTRGVKRVSMNTIGLTFAIMVGGTLFILLGKALNNCS